MENDYESELAEGKKAEKDNQIFLTNKQSSLVDIM